MPLKPVADDKNFAADGQNSEEKSEHVKLTDNHCYDNNSSDCELRNRRKDSEGEEEITLTIKLMESDTSLDSAVENYDLFHPSCPIMGSHHEARKLETKTHGSPEQSDDRNVKTVSVPLTDKNDVSVYQCKYCSEEYKDRVSLTAPCRCSGSLEYVHQDCLKNWIKIHYEGTSDSEPRCELCRYSFGRQKQYKWTHFSCPGLSRSDRWRYSIGSICVLVMVCCLLALISCFSKDNLFTKYYADFRADTHVTERYMNEINRTKETYRLSMRDDVKIVCGVLFIIFTALFIFLAKSCNIPPHKFILTYIQSSKQWTILPYSASKDSLVTGNETNI